MDPAGLTLFSFAMSHYSEKVRWALQVSQLPFREVILTPVFHVWPALRMGGLGRSALPIVRETRANGKRLHVQDSTEILLWLDKRFGPLDIVPSTRAMREECLAIEDRFDSIGRDVARFLYLGGFKHDAKVLDLWVKHTRPDQARWIRRWYPLIKWVFIKRHKVTPEASALSEQRIQQAMAWLEGRISDGRLYLVGPRLSVADITAAALLAPLACPAQHPIYGDAEYITMMRPIGASWRSDRPALDWVRRMYDLHRGEMNFQRAA